MYEQVTSIRYNGKLYPSLDDALRVEIEEREDQKIADVKKIIGYMIEDVSGLENSGVENVAHVLSHRLNTLCTSAKVFDLNDHLFNQRRWSMRTFGPHMHSRGVLDHIKKEITEIEAKPDDLSEWVDLILLAFDGAFRNGFSPNQITDALARKFRINMSRIWPAIPDPEKAIEHISKDTL